TGRTSESKVKTCTACGGRGQVVSARGSFSIAQTCSRCHGAGRIIENPCRTCQGSGQREQTSKRRIRIPAGVDTGARLRSSGHGDLHVRVAVEVPTHLHAVQKAKLQEFAGLCDENVNPISRGFFAKARNLFR